METNDEDLSSSVRYGKARRMRAAALTADSACPSYVLVLTIKFQSNSKIK